MKPNQFEYSISFIHNNLPGYIRKLYEVFITLENEIYSQLKLAYETNPYSTNNYISLVKHNRLQFIQFYRYIMSRNNQVIFQKIMQDKIKHDFTQIQHDFHLKDIEDIISFGSGGDIEAPLQSIEGFISSAPFKCFYGNSSIHDKLPLICIEPRVADTLVLGGPRGDRFWNIEISNNDLGNNSLLDDLGSVLKIDVNHVFSYFLHKLFDYINCNVKSLDFDWEMYTAFHNMINSEDEVFKNNCETMLNNYTNIVAGSAILTYMSYAGKLLGAKEDMCNWLYTKFVKDQVNDIEKGEYFKNVDITAFTDMQRSSSSYSSDKGPGDTNTIGKDEIDKEAMKLRQFQKGSVSFNPNILYKCLRLNYSNWCTCINLIMQVERRRQKPHELSQGPFYRSKIFDDTNIGHYVTMARKILKEYISHYYATYNAYVFPDNKDGLLVAGDFIKFVSNRIMDNDIKHIINAHCLNIFDVHCKCMASHCPHPRQLSDYFIDPETALGTVSSLKPVLNVLADLFMRYTYIVMLTGIFNNQSTIIDEQDALTGKSKKELFLEIYYGLIRRVKQFFENQDSWRHAQIVLTSREYMSKSQWENGFFADYNATLKNIYTPLTDFVENCHEQMANGDIMNVRSALERVRSLITINPSEYPTLNFNDDAKVNEDIDDLLTELYDIHPMSVIVELAKAYKYSGAENIANYADISNSSDFARAGRLFPQNRITLDLLNKTQLYEPKLFTSLESAEELLAKAEEDSLAGSNGNYSFMGGLSGSVTDEEENAERLGEKESSVTFGNEAYAGIIEDASSKRLSQFVENFNTFFRKAIIGQENITLTIKK
jgi:hypothetical protein